MNTIIGISQHRCKKKKELLFSFKVHISSTTLATIMAQHYTHGGVLAKITRTPQFLYNRSRNCILPFCWFLCVFLCLHTYWDTFYSSVLNGACCNQRVTLALGLGLCYGNQCIQWSPQPLHVDFMSIYLEDYPNLEVLLLKAKANSLNLAVNQPLKKALTLN